MYFAIYYFKGEGDDGAFRRAAQTWKSDMMRLLNTTEDGLFTLKSVKTESDFKEAWASIDKQARDSSSRIVQGRIFSHASKVGGDGDGLEFKPEKDGAEDGTIKRSEVRGLAKLPWHDKGHLVLHGCNSGMKGNRGWCPAQDFAERQGVRVTGQDGWAYFSVSWDEHRRFEPKLTKDPVYLWAYTRGKNGFWGDGKRREGKLYIPSRRPSGGRR